MIDKYRLEDLRRESGEKGELARWVIQLQKDLDDERRKAAVRPPDVDERLAAHEQEPVAYMIAGHYLMHANDPKVDNYASAAPLYTHPTPISAAAMPVAVVELSDYVTASGDEPRKKAVKELYEGALVVGRNLYTHPAPSIPAAVPEVDADDNFYSWFGREWYENYQQNQYTAAAKQMLGVMAESAWKASRRAAMLQSEPNGWIPVSERYPDVGNIVLTAIDGCTNVGEMESSAANYRYFTSVASGRELPATHWQPLPAAPKV
jgi:hypothetical protein